MAVLTTKLYTKMITTELAEELQNLAVGKIELEVTGPTACCGSHLRLLSGLPIARLDLSKTFVSQYDGLAGLRGFPLRSLNLEGQESIYDTNLEVLRGMSLLTDLNLASCCQIGDLGMSKLRGLPITKLNLSSVWRRFTLEGARVLHELPALMDLCIEARYRVVLAGLSLTKLCLALESYNVIRFPMNLVDMPHLPLLVNLSIDGKGSAWFRSVPSVALHGLRVLHSLVVLSLYDCPVFTIAGLEVMREMPSLKRMCFFRCPLIDYSRGLSNFWEGSGGW